MKEVLSEAKFPVGEEFNSKYITVDTLETKWKDRPLLLDVDLDAAVQEYVQSLRMTDGVVSILVVMAAAESCCQNCFKTSVSWRPYIGMTKTWARSLLITVIKIGYICKTKMLCIR